MRDYKELLVWQRACSLTKNLYRATADFPKSEQYGLTSQMRRAAVSIAANIAEGANRGSTKEYVQFVSIAIGSAAELETLIILAHSLNFLPPSELQTFEPELKEILRMLRKLRDTLKQKSA